MENLTLDELNLIRSWYEHWHIYNSYSEKESALVDKIKQAITDRGFEENAHFNLRP